MDKQGGSPDSEQCQQLVNLSRDFVDVARKALPDWNAVGTRTADPSDECTYAL